jgi:hypothetical protein
MNLGLIGKKLIPMLMPQLTKAMGSIELEEGEVQAAALCYESKEPDKDPSFNIDIVTLKVTEDKKVIVSRTVQRIGADTLMSSKDE